MHRCHARRSLPVNQNPNPTPPNLGVFELHDTAAWYSIYSVLRIGSTDSARRTRENLVLPVQHLDNGMYITLLFPSFCLSFFTFIVIHLNLSCFKKLLKMPSFCPEKQVHKKAMMTTSIFLC